jgi:hypothetical protein
MVTRSDEDVIARNLPSDPRSADRAHAREDPMLVRTRRVMRDAVASMVESCERYATAYAKIRRVPIGCDAVLGPALLEVLRGMTTLTSDGELADLVSEIISVHALDLEE